MQPIYYSQVTLVAFLYELPKEVLLVPAEYKIYELITQMFFTINKTFKVFKEI